MWVGDKMSDQFPYEQQGFFVKVRDDCFRGPFDFLKEARAEARSLGTDLEIYHGILRRMSESIIDVSKLFLVPKLKR
jgi:hypothetical protein